MKNEWFHIYFTSLAKITAFRYVDQIAFWPPVWFVKVDTKLVCKLQENFIQIMVF